MPRLRSSLRYSIAELAHERRDHGPLVRFGGEPQCVSEISPETGRIPASPLGGAIRSSRFDGFRGDWR